jgi:hypothetical protein
MLPGDGVCGWAAVTGQHDDAYPFFMQLLDFFSRCFFYRIGNTDETRCLSVHSYKHYSLSISAQGFALGRQFAGIDFEIVEEGTITKRNPVVVDLATDSFTCQ